MKLISPLIFFFASLFIPNEVFFALKIPGHTVFIENTSLLLFTRINLIFKLNVLFILHWSCNNSKYKLLIRTAEFGIHCLFHNEKKKMEWYNNEKTNQYVVDV